MSDAPKWKWHWYQHAIGFGLVRIAAVWNDRAEPTLRLGDDTLELVTGSQEAAVKQFAVQRNEFLFVGKPPEELDS